MKLFVDDEREAPEGWEWAKTVEEAIRRIANDFDIGSTISLDHDAGERGTFQPVAYFIGEKYNNDTFWADDLGILIHTANPVGRQNLKNILERYGVLDVQDAAYQSPHKKR